MNKRRISNAFTLLELLVVIGIIGMLIALLLPAVQAAREGARRSQCQNHLLQQILAVKLYEEALGVLPPGTVNDAGPIRNVPVGNHMGWIPRILPFLEQAPLYAMIDFSKGVYDPANEAAWLSPGPTGFLCPSSGAGASIRVHYMACHDGVETPIDADNRGVFFLNSGLRSRDIADGTAHTVFLGESSMYDAWRRRSAGGGGNASLGWMSGTPGTIRNTGTKLNAPSIGAVWPMPFGADGSINPATMPYEMSGDAKGRARISYSYREESSDETTEATGDHNLWETEMPEQLYVGGYGSHHPGGANFAFGNGNVRMLFDSIDPTIYTQLGRRDDAGPHGYGDD